MAVVQCTFFGTTRKIKDLFEICGDAKQRTEKASHPLLLHLKELWNEP